MRAGTGAAKKHCQKKTAFDRSKALRAPKLFFTIFFQRALARISPLLHFRDCYV